MSWYPLGSGITRAHPPSHPPNPPPQSQEEHYNPPSWKELKAMHEDVHILGAPHKRKSNADITSISDQLHPFSCCKRCRKYRMLASMRKWHPLQRHFTSDGYLVVPSDERNKSEKERQGHIQKLQNEIKALGMCGRCHIWKDVGDPLDYNLLD